MDGQSCIYLEFVVVVSPIMEASPDDVVDVPHRNLHKRQQTRVLISSDAHLAFGNVSP